MLALMAIAEMIRAVHCDGSARCCAFADEQRIVTGYGGGRVYILSLEESSAREPETRAKT